MQRNVKVGTDEYEKGKRDFGQAVLIEKIRSEAEAKSVTLRTTWKSIIKKQVDSDKTTTYTDWADVLEKLKEGSGSSAETKKRKRDDQDTTITGLVSGVDEDTKKRARIFAYEFQKGLRIRYHPHWQD